LSGCRSKLLCSNSSLLKILKSEIVFTANIPANIQEQAQIVSQLEGLISQKTLLSQLPFVTDPVAEIEELQKENPKLRSAIIKI